MSVRWTEKQRPTTPQGREKTDLKFCGFENSYYLCSMNARRERLKQQRAQLNTQLDAMHYAESEKSRRQKLDVWKSDVLTDLAKLIFAGVIIGGIFEQVDSPFILYSAGIIGLAISLTLGYVYYKRGIK